MLGHKRVQQITVLKSRLSASDHVWLLWYP